MDAERLIVALEARIRDFERNMAKAERTGTRSYQNLQRGSGSATKAMERDMLRSTSRINQALASTTSRIGAFGKAFVVGAVATGLASFATNARGAVRSMAQLGDEARRAGVDVEAFQQWKYVAEQNRIGLDSMIDGLKELNLRADEFVVTGKGPAAEAFTRLGYGARDLERALKDPNELMLDLIDRMQNLDRAAQIRVADEIFGGTAGERFVELLSQGSQGIRQTMQAARDAGAVLDAEMIQKADELDRKFAALTSSAGTFFKRFAVGAAEMATNIVTMRTELDDLFRSSDQGRAILGGGVAETLEGDSAAIEAHGDDIAALRRQYEALMDEAIQLTGSLANTASSLYQLGQNGAARELGDAARSMYGLVREFEAGEISADEFEAKLHDTTASASATLAELEAVDRAQFNVVISAVDGLIGRLASAAQRARDLRSALPGATPDGSTTAGVYSGRGGDPRTMGGSLTDWRSRTATDQAPPSSIRPETRPIDIDFGLPPVAAGGGGGGSSGGGGGQKLSDYHEEVQDTREDIRRLQMEAAELIAVADGGNTYGDAMEYARKRAELLYEAQASGRELTPELQAEIDQLAIAYTKAGQEAETAAERMALIEENAERGADRMSDLFLGIMNGSMSAKDAVAGLIAEIARMQVQKGFLALAGGSGGGGVFGFLGGLLSGERATGGPARGGSAYLVNERTPNSEVFVPSQSGGVLNVPQAQAALSGGGSQDQRVAIDVKLDVPEGVTMRDVEKVAGNVSIRVMQKEGPGMVMKTMRDTGNRGLTKRVMR